MGKFETNAFRAVGIVAVIFYLILIGRLLYADFSNAEGEMVRWTITTVLTAGGALIGLNWYQNQQRYDRDRAEAKKEAETFQGKVDERLQPLENLIPRLGEIDEMQMLAQAQKRVVEQIHLEAKLAKTIPAIGGTSDPKYPYSLVLHDFHDLGVHRNTELLRQYLRSVLPHFVNMFTESGNRIDFRLEHLRYQHHKRLGNFISQYENSLGHNFSAIDAMVDGPEDPDAVTYVLNDEDWWGSCSPPVSRPTPGQTTAPGRWG